MRMNIKIEKRCAREMNLLHFPISKNGQAGKERSMEEEEMRSDHNKLPSRRKPSCWQISSFSPRLTCGVDVYSNDSFTKYEV